MTRVRAHAGRVVPQIWSNKMRERDRKREREGEGEMGREEREQKKMEDEIGGHKRRGKD